MVVVEPEGVADGKGRRVRWSRVATHANVAACTVVVGVVSQEIRRSG
jgi:hypothetical protein